jgi:hypothetical protein
MLTALALSLSINHAATKAVQNKARLHIWPFHQELVSTRSVAAFCSCKKNRAGFTLPGQLFSASSGELNLYEASRHTKHAEGRAQQHHRRATVRDARGAAIGSKTGS